MRAVAFFRNLNQGQRLSPSTEQLLAAMQEAGAEAIATVRGNGTVVFDADDPRACVDRAVADGTGAVSGDSFGLGREGRGWV